MFALSYISAIWRRKPGSQLISFIYMMPVLLFIMCLFTRLFMPIASSVLFEMRSNYTYSYETTPYIQDFDEDGNIQNIKNPAINEMTRAGGAMLLHINKAYVNLDPQYNISGENKTYYEKSSSVDLYIARRGDDISGTPFTDKNSTEKISTAYSGGGENYYPAARLYMSANTALKLSAGKGDMSYISITKEGADFASSLENMNIEANIYGFLKPVYKATDTNENGTVYDQYQDFMALLVVEPDIYDDILENGMNVTVVAYTENSIDADKISEDTASIIENKKADVLNKYKNILRNPDIYTRFIIQSVFSVLAAVMLLSFEMSFIRKRNINDFTVMRQLGLTRASAARIAVMHAGINYLTAFAVALIICVLGYYRLALNMYCEWTVILAACLILTAAAVIYSVAATFIYKKRI